MLKFIPILFLVTLTIGCSTKKRKMAQQNNKMVKIHTAVYNAVTATYKFKKESAKYMESVKGLIAIIKKQQKALSKIDADSTMKPLKDKLAVTLDNLYRNYKSILNLMEQGKLLEAQKLITTTEKTFYDDTSGLKRISQKIAKDNNVKIQNEPAPSNAAPSMKAPIKKSTSKSVAM